MFFVGHISIAFILSYFIITRFQVRNISLSLILFLSILPDIDILFRFVGIDIAHRSITHSIIIFTIILCILLLKYRKHPVIIYTVAYLSHIAIGDLIVGPLNLLYPLGISSVSSGVYFKTSEHIFIEVFVFAIMAITVIGQYLYNRKRNNPFPFEYSKKLDPIFYPMVILAIIVSPVFLLDESQKELLEFPSSFYSLFQPYDAFNTITILALHAICLVIVAFLWIISRQSILIQYLPSKAKVTWSRTQRNIHMDKHTHNRNSSLN